MSGVNNDPAIIINFGELNEIYSKLDDVVVKNEYVQLDYGHHQLVRCLEALRLYILDHNLNPQFEVGLHE